MDMTLLNKIPKKYHPAITDIYHDSDGYWCYIENGYHIDGYYAEHTIHEDTLKEFKRIFKQIEKDEEVK